MKQFFHFLFLSFLIILPLWACSQPSVTGYEITYKPPQNINDKYVYLVGNYGTKTWVIDSAKFAKKQYLFKNKKEVLPSGFYTIQLQNKTILADFIVDQTRIFTMDGTLIDETGKIIFINSEENIVYEQFKHDLLHEKDLDIYYQTTPESLLGKFILAQYIPVRVPEFHWGSHEGSEGAAQQYYKYLINHYFDNVDFKDERLMYTPLDINVKEFFLESVFPQTAEVMIDAIEKFLARMVDENPTQTQKDNQDIYLKKLIHAYINADPKYDEVFIYLVDNYVSKTNTEFISSAEKDVFKRIADRKRRTLTGETIPAFESYTIDRHKISTADIKSKYTILWFWDPDCEHCSEYTPILCDFYAKYHELYQFDVIACSVTEDYDRWVKFIQEHHLEWFNTSYAMGAPNYDAVEYFNFADTPAVFVIDQQHKIVARQFHIDDLFEVFESLSQE